MSTKSFKKKYGALIYSSFIKLAFLIFMKGIFQRRYLSAIKHSDAPKIRDIL